MQAVAEWLVRELLSKLALVVAPPEFCCGQAVDVFKGLLAAQFFKSLGDIFRRKGQIPQRQALQRPQVGYERAVLDTECVHVQSLERRDVSQSRATIER